MMQALIRIVIAAALAVCCCPAVARCQQSNDAGGTQMSDLWKQVRELEDGQRYQEALPLLETIQNSAREQGGIDEWTRALIRRVVLTRALHGYETAVKLLASDPWPADPAYQAMLHMFSADTLWQYHQSYSWEIQQRERTVTAEQLEPDKWTAAQIIDAINVHYQTAWEIRDALGQEPVADWQELIQTGVADRRVRPTLRDFLTYQWAESLTNSAAWSAEQSALVNWLDFHALAAPPGSRAAPAEHPLERAISLLDDLYAWHNGRKELAAALEAQLQQIQLLGNHFAKERHTAALISRLEALLPAYSNDPWHAAGTNILAGLYERTGDKVTAHNLAAAGATAFPDSPGGTWCLARARQLEAPEFSIRTMAIDRSDVRSIQINYANMMKLYFRAYPVDVEAMFKAEMPYDFLPDWRDQRRLVQSKKFAAAWTVDLDNPADFQPHIAYSVPPLDKPGYYLIAASYDPDFSEANNRIELAPFLLSHFVLLSENFPNRISVLASDGLTGAPVSGMSVTLYSYDYRTAPRAVKTVASGANGRVEFAKSNEYTNHFLVARKDGHLTFDPNQLPMWRNEQDPTRVGDLVFTDRSYYRPQQKLLFKIVSYQGNGIEFNTVANRQLTVRLLDPNSEEIAAQQVTTNAFGTASGEFTIPAGRLLGLYTVATHNGQSSVHVEEYKRPTFEVAMTPPDKQMRLNTETTVLGKAGYYMGLPVSEGQVKYRVVRRTYWPWWWFWWTGRSPASDEFEVGSGRTALAEDGAFAVTFTPVADPDDGKNSAVTYAFTVNADVTNAAGETRTVSKTYRLGYTAVIASISQESEVFSEQQPVTFRIQRSDHDGNPRPGKGVAKLSLVVAPSTTEAASELELRGAAQGFMKQTDGDKQLPRWAEEPGYKQRLYSWSAGEQVSELEVEHDANGWGTFNAGQLPPGTYRLVYSTLDDWGQSYNATADVIVTGSDLRLPIPLFSGLAGSSYEVGEEARYLVASGYPGQTVWIELCQSGQTVWQRKETLDGKLLEIPVPITADLRGGFVLRSYFIHDYNLLRMETPVLVPWSDKALDIQFTSFRDLLRPGQQETWTVNVTGPGAEPAAAELLAYMHDRSLELFGPHTYPNIGGLYRSGYEAPGLASYLGVKYANRLFENLNWPIPAVDSHIADRFRIYDGYPVGGPGQRGMWGGAMLGMEGAAIPCMAPPAESSVDFAAPAPKMKRLDENALTATADVALDERDSRSGEALAAVAEAPVQLRQDFSETAFFLPHLIANQDGSAAVEFTVPDSLTSWNVYVHAVTKDLKFGSANRETVTRKDLMARPYLPRFLREGDRAVVRVQVDNAGETVLGGKLTLNVVDPISGADMSANFKLDTEAREWTAEPGRSAIIEYAVTAPSGTGSYAFKAIARSGDLSDGEQRPVPVLPSRVHLSQSKFAVLSAESQRTLDLPDLRDAASDPSLQHESLTVRVDGQLIYNMLRALPYLVNYPHECTEQTLNRFVSAGIVSALFDKYPSLKAMAKTMRDRESQFEQWNVDDPNRRMLLAETPWMAEAAGGSREMSDLINVLDPKTARAQRATAEDKLRKAQLPSGAFPWWAGGPPSPYMTMYILHGYAKLAEFGGDIPKDCARNACRYLGQWFNDHINLDAEKWSGDYELAVFLNYVLSSLPGAEYYQTGFSEQQRRQMLAYTLEHWKEIAPLSKALLAMTAARMGDEESARKVLASVMDSAKTERDQGTFWAPEDRGWLWYNDTIETHAMMLRALTEVTPDDPRLDGLAVWLLLNKKMNQWKSTRATAEVLYSLAAYMQRTGILAVPETAAVQIGPIQRTFTMKPDEYTGDQNIISVPPGEIAPETMWRTDVKRQGSAIMFASVNWAYSTEKLPDEARGDFLSVTRAFFIRDHQGKEMVLLPLEQGRSIAVGDELEIQLEITAKHPMEYVHLFDPRGAGFEPESFTSGHHWSLGICWYEEIRDSGANFFFEWLPQGTYTFKYRVRANMAGQFRVGPATLQSMYAPEFSAFSSGKLLEVKAAE